jgi:HSP20 family molecular chaperone IbpA
MWGGFGESPEHLENGKTCISSRMNEIGGFRFPLFDPAHQQQQIKINNETEKFEIIFDVKGYEKDELKIATTGGFLKVEGKHEDKSNNSSKQFSRCYKLPDSCEAESITSNYSEEGKLIMTMTKKPQDNKNMQSEPASGEEKVTPDNKVNQQSSESQPQNNEAKSEIKDGVTPNRCGEWTIYRPFWCRPIWILGQNHDSNECESKFANSSLRDSQSSTKFSTMVHNAQRTEDDRECKFTFDLKDYKPEEVKISATKNVLKVEGQHEEKCDDGSSFISRKFERSYALPSAYLIDRAESCLKTSGELTVTIPKQKVELEEPKTKDIPIKMETN